MDKSTPVTASPVCLVFPQKDTFVRASVDGSDHVPVGVDIAF